MTLEIHSFIDLDHCHIDNRFVAVLILVAPESNDPMCQSSAHRDELQVPKRNQSREKSKEISDTDSKIKWASAHNGSFSCIPLFAAVFPRANNEYADTTLDFPASTRRPGVYRWPFGRFAFHMTFSLDRSLVEWSTLQRRRCTCWSVLWETLDAPYFALPWNSSSLPTMSLTS
jgi:hypothetical protein